MQWHLGDVRPEFELVALTTALVAAVAVHRHVYGERSPMLWLGFVQRTVSVPLISSTTNTLEVDQVKNLFHANLATESIEVDAWHGWSSFLVR